MSCSSLYLCSICCTPRAASIVLVANVPWDPAYGKSNPADQQPGRFPARKWRGTERWSHPNGRRLCRGRVSQVIGRYINGLGGSDGSLTGSGNTFLQQTHVSGQGGLVTNGGRHAAEQRGHLVAGLGETEDIVDKYQHVHAAYIAEIFGDGQTGQTNPQAGSGRFVHLSDRSVRTWK